MDDTALAPPGPPLILTATMLPLAAFMGILMGAIKIRLRARPGARGIADIVDGVTGAIIGDACRLYVHGWAVFTAPYGGYVPDVQIDMEPGADAPERSDACAPQA